MISFDFPTVLTPVAIVLGPVLALACVVLFTWHLSRRGA